jgi:hypothetical protein
MGRLSPADFRTVYGFRRPNATPVGAHARFAVWTIPSPSPGKARSLGAARLVSTPSRLVSLRAWLGIAISGFPDFEQFCIAGFPGEHSSFSLSPLRMPFRHARARLSYS